MSSAKAAERYIRRGLAPVPIPPGRKGPDLPRWQDLRLKPEDAARYFTNGQNVGLLLGAPSGGLVDVDLDAPEAAKVAGRFLPPTLTSGRETAPHSHWWYRCAGARTEKWRDLDGDMLVELRSTGCQTVVAPSVHPDGDRYLWHEGLEVAEVSADELARGCRDLAAAVLVARHMPPVGGRHDFALALVGYLLRRLDAESVRRIVHAAWDAAGDANREAHQDLDGITRDTDEKLAAGEHVSGGRRLEEYAAGVPRLLAWWYGWSISPAGDDPPPSPNGHGATGPPGRFNLTDLGNAERFVARHGEDLRYCWSWKAWLAYDGRRYAVDDTGGIYRMAADTVASIYGEAAACPDEERRKALAKHALRSEAGPRVREMVALARSKVPVRQEELDADAYLFNVLNGTLDLRTGELREHRREDRIAKLAPVEYDPDATAPTWAATLERVLPSGELRRFFQKLVGYALTGNVSEHVLPFLYGTGANGKSTILNALLAVVGEYGMQAAPDLLVAKKGSHPTEVADLFGMRLVASIEVEDGRRLAESLVKQLTGGDKVRARRMRENFWQFDPTHKVFMAVNHKPEVRGTDTAIWRRIRLIPFTETIPPAEQDKRLPQKLGAELSGILRWAVEGCLAWQREGLQAPEEVRKATGQYRSEMDVMGAFLQDECEIGPGHRESFADLYKRYEEWCEEGGERAETRRKFNARLKERGRFEARRSGPGGANEWHGLRLLKKQTSGFAGKLKQRSESTHERPEIEASRDEPENSFSSSVTSVDAPTSPIVPVLSDEAEDRVRRCVREGMAERIVRREALREPRNHAPGCPCEDCS